MTTKESLQDLQEELEVFQLVIAEKVDVLKAIVSETVAEKLSSIDQIIADLEEEPTEPEDPEDPEKPIFGGMFAPFRIGKEDLDVDPQSDNLVNKFYAHTGGKIRINCRRWCPAKYYTEDADIELQVKAKQPSWGNLHNQMIPWNMNWKIPRDKDDGTGDNTVLIVDRDTGHCWDIWAIREVGNGIINCGSANIILEGFRTSGSPHADIKTKETPYQVVGAAGFPNLHMLVTREDVERGYFGHAIRLLWANPPRGEYVAPAIKGPGGTGSNPSEGRLKMGTRIIWEFPDDYVTNYLANQPVENRPVLMMFIDALRIFGGIGTDHGGTNGVSGATWMEHDDSARWGELGINIPALETALNSLISGGKQYAKVIKPPVFPGNDFNQVARYERVVYPS